MNTALIAATNNANRLANEVTFFWAGSVGQELNKLEEFSLLVEWHDAAVVAQAEALNARSWVDVKDMDAMLDECNMWLEHCV